MAGELQSFVIAAPGNLGLNTKQVAVDSEANFATQAENAVFDRDGQLVARDKWYESNMGAGSAFSGSVYGLKQDRRVSGGVIFDYVYGCANNEIWKGQTTSVGSFTSLTQVATYTAATADYWQFARLGDNLFAFQRNTIPKRIYGALGTNITDIPAAGAPPTANCVVAAYNRLWAGDASETDPYTLYWSDLLDGLVWNAGTAGSLDMRTIWTDTNDRITAIAPFNGFLVVFSTKAIVVLETTTNTITAGEMIYNGPVLKDIILGVGCIARDSVQNTGEDIIFLSQTGVRSLGRVIQEKAAPQYSISANVEDDIQADIAAMTGLNSVTSTTNSLWWPTKNWYILCIPQRSSLYVFDMSSRNEQGAARVTKWASVSYPASMVLVPATVSELELMLCSMGSRILVYGGSQTTVNNGTIFSGESTANFIYSSPWLTMGEQAGSFLKFMKNALITCIDSTPTSTVSLSFDYSSSTAFSTPVAANGTSNTLKNKKAVLGGSGGVVKFTYSQPLVTYLETNPKIQRIVLTFKLGRLWNG